jgi:putative sigma-54 modulation protein
MIKSIQMTGIAYEVDEPTRKYALKKIGSLDRYLPRHARKTVSAEIKLEQVDHSYGNKYEVEVNMIIPGKVINARDTAANILSVIDIVETKLRGQLRSYKQKTVRHISQRGVMSRFKRSFQREL